MTVLNVAEAVLIVVALVYIVALLRSHADILRRLAILEDAREPTPAGTDPATVSMLPFAPEVRGVTLAGRPVTVAFDAGSPMTLLAFLTSGCGSCRALWADLRDESQLAMLGVKVLVITQDPSRESLSRLRELRVAAVEVIMSAVAWSDYEIPSSPHFVLTDGRGGIAGRGSAMSWSQLIGMVAEARADADAAGVPARTTRERAERAERALEDAGIGPGHPSLYPSASVGDGVSAS